MNPEQSTDGNPHMSYYIGEHQLSFVWDGAEPFVEVSHGGYGEPVIDSFPINGSGLSSPLGTVEFFARRCDDYIRNFWEKDGRCYFMQKQARQRAREIIDQMTDDEIKEFLDLKTE